jgi:hypothetical protein
LTMTGLTKTRTKGELTLTVFRLVLSACKLNLPLVPSQDYVLQDNKRCYDKIFEWLEFQTPFKCILVGLINMIDSMRFWTPIFFFFFTDIKHFLLAHGYVALTNDMLKTYKVAQVWIFLSGWLQEAYFLKTMSNNNNNLCILRKKCSPSQTLDDDTHNA